MKTELEQQDIEAIVKRVEERLKPLIVSNNKHVDKDSIFNVKGLADYLKVSKKWIYERTHLKEIPYYKKEGLLRFRKKDIDKWFDTFKVPVASKPTEGVMKLIKPSG